MLRKLFILFLLATITNSMSAQQTIINYFSAGEDICTPVTVKTGRLGTFQVGHTPVVKYGDTGWVEAYDCQGRKILDNTPDRGGGYSTDKSKPKEYEYIFTTLYPESSNNSNTYSNNNSSSYSSSNHNIGAGYARAAQIRSQIPMDGYPNFQLQVGASRLYGEFARLKFCGGGEGGFAIYGGVGKDYLFKGEYDDRLLWHVAVGYYGTIGDASDFTLGVSYAQTSQLYDKVMGLDGTFSFYFGDSTRFGVFIGGGAGVTSPFGYLTGDDPDDVKLTWDINVGIAFKLWTE